MPAHPVGDCIDIGEDSEIFTMEYLSEFMEKIWPMYEHHGFTRDTALIAWSMGQQRIILEAMLQTLGEDNGF